MVENLDDLGVLRPAHRLGELVVVDEDELLPRRIDEIRLERQADEAAVVVHDREHRLWRPLDHRSGLDDARLP